MKHTTVLLLMVLSAALFSQQQMISFERDGAIYTAGIDGSNQNKILEGYQHSISPDGHYISYTYNLHNKRYPAIYDIAAEHTTKFESASNGNGYFPVFSPDGKYLVFSDFISSNWEVSMVDIASGKVTKLSSGTKNLGFHSPRWAHDSKSVLCHDLGLVYEFDITGNSVKRFDISPVMRSQEIYLSSINSFVYNKDKTSLIFDNDRDWEAAEPDKAGLFKYDIAANTITMITDINMVCLSPFVDYTSGKIYFSGCYKKDVKLDINGEAEIKWCVYRINEDGTNPEKIIDNAHSPTVSQF